ncbi:hypothetical protein RUM44_000966 [Polyplax serrata]|uniref:Receptor expression-enhancing protein n=1 Tax=Polyplax serrata TaxID=468196 RepID=A0ABR1B9H4_POLSC
MLIGWIPAKAVKWMMYWIVFALFTCFETFTDLFLSFWFPFYYELKIITVIYLLSPATNGSSILYRKFVHPVLAKREQEIDDYIAKAKEQGYHTMLNLGSKGVTYATSLLMQTAIKGLPSLQMTPSSDFLPEKRSESGDSFNLEESSVEIEEIKDIQLTASDKIQVDAIVDRQQNVDVLWMNGAVEATALDQSVEKQPIKAKSLRKLASRKARHI